MSDDKSKKDIDNISGVETTGHEWDGLKELNNPLPRWWLWVMFATIVWSIGYWVVYPAWPVSGGHTKGVGDYTQYNELTKNQAEIFARQEEYLARFDGASFDEIMADPELYAFSIAGGASAFKSHCTTCHGSGAAGGKGYPNLNDDDWIWGGRLRDIKQTLTHGIRENNLDTRMSQMPAFGRDKLLNREQITDVVAYVLSLSADAAHGEVHESAHGGGHHEGIAGNVAAGQVVFKNQCAACHGADGKGLREFGAPNLTDKIWLYGGDEHTVYETVYNARAGMMPAWGGRLDENTLKQLSIYVHQLGGGEEDEVEPVVIEEAVSDDAVSDDDAAQEDDDVTGTDEQH